MSECILNPNKSLRDILPFDCEYHLYHDHNEVSRYSP